MLSPYEPQLKEFGPQHPSRAAHTPERAAYTLDLNWPAVAVPCFYVGRLIGARLIFIETFDRIETPTLTGRIVNPVTQHMFVQVPEQRGLYRRAEVLGPLL